MTQPARHRISQVWPALDGRWCGELADGTRCGELADGTRCGDGANPDRALTQWQPRRLQRTSRRAAFMLR